MTNIILLDLIILVAIASITHLINHVRGYYD